MKPVWSEPPRRSSALALLTHESTADASFVIIESAAAPTPSWAGEGTGAIVAYPSESTGTAVDGDAAFFGSMRSATENVCDDEARAESAPEGARSGGCEVPSAAWIMRTRALVGVVARSSVNATSASALPPSTLGFPT